jgi:hypothetical protein
MSTNPAIDPTATEGLSQIERVVDAIIAPSKTFQDILRSAAWWMPFLVMVIFTVGQTVVVDRQVGFDRVSENQIKSSPRSEERLSQLTPEQRATQMALSTTITKVSSYCAPLLLLIFFALYSLIVWAAFNFGFGAQTTFGQVFAVTWYAAMPYVFRSLLGMITLLAGSDTESFNLQNPVGTNLAYYLPDAAPWLKAMLMQLDIIGIWSLVLMVMGMSIVAKKTITQSAIVIVGFWLVVLVLSTGAAAAFS